MIAVKINVDTGVIMQKISFLFLGTSLSLIPSLTFAQCVATQDCATLGYTETSCNGGKGVKCPFGNSWACFKTDKGVKCPFGNSWACFKTDSEIEQQFCDKYGFQYTCSGTGYSGGSGAACGGKYAACTCASGYEWKEGSCQQQVLNGAVGELYYCNGTVVGVRATGTATGMGFYVAMKDLGNMTVFNAINQCQSYSFCGNFKGTLPTREQLLSIYNNKSRVNTLLSTNGGTEMTEDNYWSSSSRGNNYGYNIVNMSDGSYASSNELVNRYVRPVLSSY